MLRDFAEGIIRKEIRGRVNEILKAGNEWCNASKSLQVSLDALTKAVASGTVPTETIKPVNGATKNLAGKTAVLAKAFTNFNATLEKIAKQI
jgi:hypothetical protein